MIEYLLLNHITEHSHCCVKLASSVEFVDWLRQIKASRSDQNLLQQQNSVSYVDLDRAAILHYVL